MDCKLLLLINNALDVHHAMLRPLLREYGIQPQALQILLFLYRNPDKNTAADVCQCQGMKQSMISFYVDKLVQDGYLIRQPVPGDRRKVKLQCTEKALPLVKQGDTLQKELFGYVFKGVSKEEEDTIEKAVNTMQKNLNECRKKIVRGEFRRDAETV